MGRVTGAAAEQFTRRRGTSAKFEAGDTKDGIKVEHGRRAVVHADCGEHRSHGVPRLKFRALLGS